MSKTAIDEGLYSRQLYVMGHEAQSRMSTSKVCIIGLNGTGVEIAKNIILAGVFSCTLVDPTPASHMDLASQFYLTESHVEASTPRAAASLSSLASLNAYVAVSVTPTLQEIVNSVADYTAIVVTDDSIFPSVDALLEFSDTCHSANVAFIKPTVAGLFCQVFCDFGSSPFVVADPDGEATVACMIASLTPHDSGELQVTVTEDTRHQLSSGDVVLFTSLSLTDSDVANLLMSSEGHVVKSVSDVYNFTISFTGYKSGMLMNSGGNVSKVKQPVELSFKSFRSASAEPQIVTSDFCKINSQNVCHAAFAALLEYQRARPSCLPAPGSVADFEFFTSLFQSKDLVEKNLKFLKAFASGSSALIAPMTAFVGGLAGQEVLKACSKKFTPINQFFYFDAIECLVDNAEDIQPIKCRYDALISIFGQAFVKKVHEETLFLVGAGAIGCEMLKNWALMGVGCNNNNGTNGGHVYVTDMDTIEKSNLNRQFLFRPENVSAFKSTTAAEAVKVMNPSLNITAYNSRVGQDEAHGLFNDEFYENLTGICTALDNVDARLYMDSQVLFYKLPMYESGTLGTKGNVQIVLPGKTENYGASRDPPEASIPICTLKNFPYKIEHTLQHARDWFEGTFFQSPSDVNTYLSSQKVKDTSTLHDSLVTSKPLSLEDCIKWARVQFDTMFRDGPLQLLYNFPHDQLTSTGTPFWSGTKKAPVAIEFSVSDELHLEFITSVANARAIVYGLTPSSDLEFFKTTLANIMTPDFVPKAGVKIASTEAELKEADKNNESSSCANDVDDLPSPSSLAGYRVAPIVFDKDNDEHMKVIVAASNLRARNYGITEADLHQSRFIAGKIIPAIATTTAAVTGLVCFELLKVIGKKEDVAMYKNGFINLALPLTAFSEPMPPKVTKSMLKGSEYNFSAWDTLDIKGGRTPDEMTLKEFLAYFEEEFGLEVSMLSYGVKILYSSFTNAKKIKERLPMTLEALVSLVAKKELSNDQKFLSLEVCCVTLDEFEDVDLPSVRFRRNL